MSQPVYTPERFKALLAGTVEQLHKLSTLKGGEYSGDVDRLANFRRNGAAQGLPMETIWSVYAAKHWDAIQQYIKDERNGVKRNKLEPIEGRVDDLIVYLMLFKAMLDEQNKTKNDIYSYEQRAMCINNAKADLSNAIQQQPWERKRNQAVIPHIQVGQEPTYQAYEGAKDTC